MHEHEHRPGGNAHDLASWEERYRVAPALWSGRVNPPLMAEAGDLAPGRAGRRLRRGRRRAVARRAGMAGDRPGLVAGGAGQGRGARRRGRPDRAGRLDTRGRRLLAAADGRLRPGHRALRAPHRAPPGAADDPARCGGRPGGTLLWVGHPYDEERAAAWGGERFPTASQVAAELDPAEWEVVVAARRSRESAADGHHDADEVLRARRR